MKPDDIPQWAWDEAGRVFCELLSIPSEVYQEESWSLDQEHIARALLEAERRAEERNAETIRRLQDNMSKMAMDWTKAMASERQTGIAEGMEKAAALIEHGFDKLVGEPYRADGTRSKNDKCPHGRYMYEDCEQCCSAAIRAAAKEIEP